MIATRRIAWLELSAASGLVRDGATVHVVADDEHVLDAYELPHGDRRGRVALLPDTELPGEHRARKRLKADLECLALLPDRRLLALGSGSSDRRQRAVVLELPQLPGGLPRAPRVVDLAPLYHDLGRRFPQLNIEGAAACGGLLRLLQRGNGRDAHNAVIDLDLPATLDALTRGCLTPELVRAVHTVNLGELQDVPLGFTDASPLDPASARLAFVAAAEDTDDPYEDGPCPGSVMGVLDAAGAVEWVEPVEGGHKLEGLAVTRGEPALAVADPDDRARPAPLLEAAVRF